MDKTNYNHAQTVHQKTWRNGLKQGNENLIGIKGMTLHKFIKSSRQASNCQDTTQSIQMLFSIY